MQLKTLGILALAIFIVLTGCSQYKPDKFTEKDLGVYDTVLKKSIKMGMTKEEVEKLFGHAGNEEKYFIVYDGLVIGYRDNKVVAMKFNEDERYETYRGVTINTPRSVVEEKYGSIEGDFNTINYLFESSKGGYKKLDLTKFTTSKVDESDKSRYFISFFMDDEKMVRHVLIWDRYYSMFVK